MRQRIDELTLLDQEMAAVVDALDEPARRYAALQAELKSLPDEGLSQGDEAKIARLENHLVDQLREYGFRSFDPGEVEVSRNNYRPAREGYDLGFDLSASDWIRLIWGYLLGLLEVARESSTNHPGLLIFDEPRQQSADPVSMAALVRRAGLAAEHHQQVIFATSEPEDSMREMLTAVADHQYHGFDGKILRPLL